VLGDYAGANAFFMAEIRDRLGLFAVLAANEPLRTDPASRTACRCHSPAVALDSAPSDYHQVGSTN
jgi:hypothetical protein